MWVLDPSGILLKYKGEYLMNQQKMVCTLKFIAHFHIIQESVSLTVAINRYNLQSPFDYFCALTHKSEFMLVKITTWQAEIRGLSNSGFHCFSCHDHRYLNRQHKPKLMQLHGCKVIHLRHAKLLVLPMKLYLSPIHGKLKYRKSGSHLKFKWKSCA